jgi:hypothetical protein
MYARPTAITVAGIEVIRMLPQALANAVAER